MFTILLKTFFIAGFILGIYNIQPFQIASVSKTAAFENANDDIANVVSSATQVATGGFHTCAITTDGKVKCWGSNHYGQLGNGTNTDSSTPVNTIGLEGDVKIIAAGENHTCALLMNGQVKCWGFNLNGQVGDSTGIDKNVPTYISELTNQTATISLNYNHSCVVTVDMKVKCWGLNNYGQLGDGTYNDKFSPTIVSQLTNSVKAVTLGSFHTCVITISGGIKCWGMNSYGQLGNGTFQNSSAPVNVSNLESGVIDISAGTVHMCAISINEGVLCWGANNYGELGDGTYLTKPSPSNVSGLRSDVVSISAGSAYVCGLLNSGEVKCWGFNGTCQLGYGSNTQPTPITLSELTNNITAISAGTGYSCFITNMNNIKCLGRNDYGQLGDGTTSTKCIPVQVIGFENSAANRNILFLPVVNK